MRGRGGISRWRNRRRILLLAFAFAYIMIGSSYIFMPPDRAISPTLVVILDLAPLRVWGFVWFLCGLGMVMAAVHHWHERLAGDIGFGVGFGMPLLWGLLAGASVFSGAERGWVTAIVYWTMAGAILAAAGMVDPRFSEVGS